MNVHPMKALLFPHLADFPDALEDAADAPPEAKAIRLTEKARNFQELARRSKLRTLWCFRIDAERMHAISQCQYLAQLYLDDVRVDDLSPVAKLRELKSLSLNGAPKAVDLDQPGELTSLQALAVVHFPKVRLLNPLERLVDLRALAVAGSVWTRMTVESLKPLATLTGLRFLHLTNLKALDESLEPLAELAGLEELECANVYPMEQFARLAAALPDTRCLWFSPFVALPNVACRKCGRGQLVVLTGKGKSTLCRDCDNAGIQNHEEAFRRIVT